MNFIEELKWRGLFYDMIPGTEAHLTTGKRKGYIGFDPTAISLGIGNFVQVILLIHLQKAGHIPYALVGGATGMIGDPSGKSAERNLLDEDTLNANVEAQRKQLAKYIDLDGKVGHLVNNYDWFKEINVLHFLRDVGKHLTVNYMLAKDSVKSRMETGLSFTEFSYQLIQGYDFYHLNKHHGVTLQLGGSDQWGNLVAGSELIRRKGGEDVFAATTPLVTKSDGGKFGKTEDGNLFIDPNLTSPYKLYQFWLNTSDDDAANFIKIFTFLGKDEIGALIEEHQKAPHARILQNKLAEEATAFIHNQDAVEASKSASRILFGKAAKDELAAIDEKMFLEVFEGVPQYKVAKSIIESKVSLIDFLTETTGILTSKGEARRALKENSISINKEKVADGEMEIETNHLINNKYILAQRGKKNYFLIIAE